MKIKDTVQVEANDTVKVKANVKVNNKVKGQGQC